MRPILRYFGGKWNLAPWIVSQFPPHKVYVEPFGGAASVLLRKPRSYAEIYNDLNETVVNVFQVARDNGAALQEALRLTPFARSEFDLSYEESSDPVERARRTIIRSFMGFGADGIDSKYKTGFRSNSNRSGTTPAHDWKNYADAFPELVDRLRGVVIENRDYKAVCDAHDGEETLHYIDPPYVFETRQRPERHGYKFELTDDQHRELAAYLNGLKGMVVVSGYPSELYEELFSGWERITRRALADSAGERTEVLWLKNIKTMRLL